MISGSIFVCLFVWSLSSHSRIFHSYGEVTIAGEVLLLTYARHSWPLSSEDSLTCHTYCKSGHPCIMVISKDMWHLHMLQSVWQWSCHYLFLWLRSVATGDWTLISCMRPSTSTPPLQSFLVVHVWHVWIVIGIIFHYIQLWVTNATVFMSM